MSSTVVVAAVFPPLAPFIVVGAAAYMIALTIGEAQENNKTKAYYENREIIERNVEKIISDFRNDKRENVA